MTQFEFLAVFISIVLALGVSDILLNWGDQIRLRKYIHGYGLHFAWTALVLVLMIQLWWTLWEVRERTDWTFPEYLLLIAPFLIVALIAYVFTPSLQEGERDIKRYYFEHSPWIFGLSAGYLAVGMLYAYVILRLPIIASTSLILLLALLLTIVLAFWKNERFHIAAVVLGYLLTIAWMAATFFRL